MKQNRICIDKTIISILTDNPKSWIIPYVEDLKQYLKKEYIIRHFFRVSDIEPGDILLILSCEKIIKEKYLKLHKNNIVIHPSALPKGKGWSPLAWQVLEGKKNIPITLFEATKELDAGPIYLSGTINLDGTELNDEIKHKQGMVTIDLIKKYLKEYPNNHKTNQIGEETFYPRRTKEDSKLDVNKTLLDQFNLLRVVDNDRYPAFFEIDGIRFNLIIHKENK